MDENRGELVSNFCAILPDVLQLVIEGIGVCTQAIDFIMDP